MNGSLDGAPLLSEAALLDLGCIKYDPEGKFQRRNRSTIEYALFNYLIHIIN